MEYTVLTCWYRIRDGMWKEPGSGPYSKQVSVLLSEGWEFRGDMKVHMHTEWDRGEKKIYVLFVQEFVRKKKEEETA